MEESILEDEQYDSEIEQGFDNKKFIFLKRWVFC